MLDHAGNPFDEMFREALGGMLRNLMVCMPGRVTAFDPGRQRAQIQPGIRRVLEGQPITMPVISDVPVQFAGNDQWYAWHEVTVGTEGLIHFSQRAIDTWLSQGGPATPNDFRMFSAEDAFFSPGYRSNPGVIPGFVNEGCGLSSYDGSTRIHLTNEVVTIRAGDTLVTIDGSGVTIDGQQVTVNANTTVNGNLGTTGTMINNGTNVGSTHIHPQGDDSDGNSEQDTGPPQ